MTTHRLLSYVVIAAFFYGFAPVLTGANTAKCYVGKPVNYKGDVSVTRGGITCQRWDSQQPHRHNFYTTPDKFIDGVMPENYCRTPTGGGEENLEPWCYTIDSAKRWDLCDVSKCKIWYLGPNGKAYINLYKENKDKEASKQLCKDAGAFLPTPRNAEENNFLKKFAKSFHLGLNRRNDGVWIWDTTATTVRWDNWISGEPNGGASESCVLLWESSGWIDKECTSTDARTVVCERDQHNKQFCESPATVPDDLDCLAGFVIRVVKSTYGRRPGAKNPCPSPLLGSCNTTVDTTAQVAGRCNDKQTCSRSFSHKDFGDPCHGASKISEVVWECVPKSKAVPDDEDKGKDNDIKSSVATPVWIYVVAFLGLVLSVAMPVILYLAFKSFTREENESSEESSVGGWRKWLSRILRRSSQKSDRKSRASVSRGGRFSTSQGQSRSTRTSMSTRNSRL